MYAGKDPSQQLTSTPPPQSAPLRGPLSPSMLASRRPATSQQLAAVAARSPATVEAQAMSHRRKQVAGTFAGSGRPSAAVHAGPVVRRNPAHGAVTVSFLREFYERKVAPLDAAAGREMTTSAVVEQIILPLTAARRCRYIELPDAAAAPGSTWAPGVGSMWFVSHAFGNPFRLAVHSVLEWFRSAGAREEEAYVWLDIFAINQWNPGADLDAGNTLRETISLSSATLVILDKAAVPLRRLWCLYEIGSTPQDRLVLVTHEFSVPEIASAFATVDAETAACFDPGAEALIRSHICRRYGSVRAFTVYLKLTLVLRPLRVDVTDLLRLAPSAERLAALRDHAAKAAHSSSALCAVVGGSGQGKSTLAALASRQEWVDAYHFCDGGDARTRSAVRAAQTLAFQLASAPPRPGSGGATTLRFPAFTDYILGLDPAAVLGLQNVEDAVRLLLMQPLRLLPPGETVTLLLDALEEAEASLAPSALTNPMVRLLSSIAVGAEADEAQGVGPRLMLIITTRQDPPHILRALRGRWGDRLKEWSPRDFLLPPSPPIASALPPPAAPEPISRCWSFRCKGAACPCGGLGSTWPGTSPAKSSDVALGGPVSSLNVETLGAAASLAAGPGPPRRVKTELLPPSTATLEAGELNSSKILLRVAAEFRKEPGAEAIPPPSTLSEAYRSWFALQWPPGAEEGAAAARALALLLAAREPPTAAAVHALGAREPLQSLPGWGVLFFERSCRIHLLHRSLAEWLIYKAPPPFRVDVRAGHRAWAAFLVPRSIGLASATFARKPDSYAVKYLVSHCSEAGEFIGLEAALLDFDFIEACVRAAGGYSLLEAVAAAQATLQGERGEQAEHALRVVTDVLRWLLRQHSHLAAEPRSVLQRASAAPPSSTVGCALRAFYRQPKLRVLNPPSCWAPDAVTITAGAPVRCVCVSPCGRFVLSASGREAVVSAAATGQEVARLSGHAREVRCCAWTSGGGRPGVTLTGGRMATGGEDKSVRLFDAATGTLVWLGHGHTDSVTSVAFNTFGTFLCTASDDASTRVWDIGTGVMLVTLRDSTARVTAVAWAPGEQSCIAAASFDGFVRLWQLPEVPKAGTLLRRLEPSARAADPILCAAFSPDGRRLAAGGMDCTVTIFESLSGRELASCRANSWIHSVAWAPDGSRIVSAGEDNAVLVWKTLGGAAQGALGGGHSGGVYSVAWTPCGTRVVSGSKDRSVKIWDAAAAGAAGPPRARASVAPLRRMLVSSEGSRAGARAHSITAAPQAAPLSGSSADSTTTVALAPDGDHALSASSDHTLSLWRLSAKAEAPLRVLQGHSGAVLCCAIAPDGSRAVSGARDCTLRLWNLSTLEAANAPIEGHRGPVSAVAFSPTNSATLASASHDGTLRIWDLAQRPGPRSMRTLKGHGNWVNAVVFSPDGRRLLSGGHDRKARLWDVQSARELRTFHGHNAAVMGVSWAPDSERVVSGSSLGSVIVHDVCTGAALLAIKHNGAVNATGWPVAAVFMSAGEDGTIKIWRAADGSCAATFFAEAPVSGVGYTTVDAGIVAAGSDSWVLAAALRAGGRPQFISARSLE